MIKTAKTNKIKWSRRDTALFLEKVRLYISSGLALDHALEIVLSGYSKKRDKYCLNKIIKSIKGGASFASSLSANLYVSAVVISLLRQGEISGNLPQSMEWSKDILEKKDALVKKCLSAMTYPVVIAIFSLVLTIALMRFVMPQIVPMLKSLNVDLPLMTRVVIAISDIIVRYGLYIIIGIFAISLSFSFLYRRSKRIYGFCQLSIGTIPVIGSLTKLFHISVFTRSFGSTIMSGAIVSSAYIDNTATISFIPLRQEFVSKNETVANGRSLGSVFSSIKSVPSYLPAIVSAGEVSGSLGQSLLKCSDIIDSDIDNSLKKMTSLLEPLMMIVTGLLVGAVALSIMMPIYDISKTLQQ